MILPDKDFPTSFPPLRPLTPSLHFPRAGLNTDTKSGLLSTAAQTQPPHSNLLLETAA